MICSVVPAALPTVRSVLERKLKLKATVVGREVRVPIKNRYRPPGAVGQDRLVCAYAAMRLYGTPAIVIDLGTAITLDVVSAGGEYVGGIIVPGIRLTAESLAKKTALLPEAKKIAPPRTLVGKNTRGSILSGIFYGYGALCGGLAEQIGGQFKKKPVVVITGGYVSAMKKFISHPVDHVDKDLVFKGLAFLSESSTLSSEC